MKISPRRISLLFTAMFIGAFYTYLDSMKIDKTELFLHRQQQQNNTIHCSLYPPDKQFEEIISKYAKDNAIALSLTDLGMVEMAENLFESSFKRFNIDNYLFVCSHEKAEQYLVSRGIHAISLWNDSESTSESAWGKKDYNAKTFFKTEAVYKALCLGYNVLLVDVDIVFLQNPLPYLLQFSTSYDIVIQHEYSQLNSGFFLATTKPPSIELQERMLMARRNAGTGMDQTYLNNIVNKEMKGSINIKRLPWKLFPWGGYYFRDGHREFSGDNNLTEPYIVHGTGGGGFAGKRYRFRSTSCGTWILTGKEIGPVGHHCNALSMFGKKPFPLDALEGLYREHMFLHHPLVPHSVKQSQSDIINIRDIVDKQHLDENHTNLLLDALKEFETYSVIRLNTLHDITIQANSPLWSRFNSTLA